MIDERRRKIAFQAIRLAGNYLQEMFNGEVKAKIKPDSSWVSEVDCASEDLIVKSIGRAFPDDGILTEESSEKKSKNQYRWVIDPLDGTHNFLVGLYDFGCGLSLERENELIFGICYFPKYHQTFWAEKRSGAFCNGKKIRVSGTKEFRAGIFIPDSNFRIATQRSLDDIKALSGVGCSIRINGCSHRALMCVASGRALIAISRSGKPWDLSPGALILKEAGGMITNEDGVPWRIGSREIIATNGFVHSTVLDLIRRKDEST